MPSLPKGTPVKAQYSRDLSLLKYFHFYRTVHDHASTSVAPTDYLESDWYVSAAGKQRTVNESLLQDFCNYARVHAVGVLAIAYALKTILAELPYELAEEEACSAREVKEAVVAETAEPGLQETGSRLFLTSYCRSSTPAYSTGRSGQSVPVSALAHCGVALSYCVLHWEVEAALVQSMAVVVVAERDATGLAVTACRALVGQLRGKLQLAL
eukprot:s4010_g6.t1